MAVNRVAGLVLPYTSKTLLDKVLSQTNPHPELLPRIIALVFSAMIVQAITSFSLTQLLSKAGQRLIAEMRRQVQKHVGLLSVAYYDENRTGTLVARIMSDVEGVRNLVGTGLVEFVGGLLTAVLAFVYLLHRSALVTLTVFSVVGLFVFVLQYAFKKIRPIFRESGKINAEVTGRLTESLGGVRVIKGYHAEEREASVFASRRRATAEQRDEVADTDQRAGVCLYYGAGAGFSAGDVAGRPRRVESYMDRWRLLQLQHVSGHHGHADLPDREHWHATYGSICRPRPYSRNHGGTGGESGSKAQIEDAVRSKAMCASTRWSSLTSRTSQCCTASAFEAEQGTRDGAGGFIGLGQVNRHQPASVHFTRQPADRCWWTGSTWPAWI